MDNNCLSPFCNDLFDLIQDGIVLFDSEKNILKMNTFSREILFDQSLDDPLFYEHKIDQLITGYECNKKYVNKEFAIQVRTMSKVIQVTDCWNINAANKHLIIIRDITGSKSLPSREELDQIVQQRTADLLQERDFISTVMNTAATIILILDKAGKIISLNKFGEQLTGFKLENVKDKFYWDVFFPEHLVDFQQSVFVNTDITEYPITSESYIYTISAEALLIAWKNSLVCSETGSVEFIVYSGLDITEFKNVEDELVRSNWEFDKMLGSISSVLIGIDDKDIVFRWNKKAEELFQINAVSIKGKKFCSASGINWNWEKIEEAIAVCSRTANLVKLENFTYTDITNREKFLNITINPVKTDAEFTNRFLILAEDITENRIMESQLVQAQKLESIGQLAAGIAHEINTPIQYVTDNAVFLRDSFDDMKGIITKYQEWFAEIAASNLALETIKEAHLYEDKIDLEYLMIEVPKAIAQSLEGLERVGKIVRAMKEFSHPGLAEKTMVDINKAIESTVTVAKNEWKYVSEMELKLDYSMPLVLCFPGELNQVILNMIINAAHSIADKVKVVGGKGQITIATSYDNESVAIRITDTGSGIPEKIKSKIFDPFFTTKEVGKGTGQGLAIAHSVIVDKHKGEISVDTELGIGTTFIIKIPLSERNATAAMKPEAANQHQNIKAYNHHNDEGDSYVF